MNAGSAETTIVIRGRTVVPGIAEAEALVTRDRISGWGGVDPRDGTVVETRHELRGQSFAGKVLVFPGAKGSSGWSASSMWRAPWALHRRPGCSTACAPRLPWARWSATRRP